MKQCFIVTHFDAFTIALGWEMDGKKRETDEAKKNYEKYAHNNMHTPCGRWSNVYSNSNFFSLSLLLNGVHLKYV